MKGHGYYVGKQQNRTERPAPSPAISHMLVNALQHHVAGQLNEAEQIYRKILTYDEQHADSLHLLGVIAHQGGRHDVAVEMIRKAITINKKAASYYSNLGNALQAQGKLDEAAEEYKRALALKPNLAEVYVNLGNILQAQRALDESVACYERALALNPNYADIYSNLGNARQYQGRLDDAVACYERALEIKPDFATAHYNFGNVLHLMGNLDEALVRYRKALALQPDYAQAAFGEGLVQLHQGNFGEGWHKYEMRWQSKDHDTPWRTYQQPLWKGEKLTSVSLLIWGEQGVGDEIMFAGLLPDVLRTGNHCILDCDARLKPLFARSFPRVDIVSGNAPNPLEFAAHMPSGSLPGLFRTTPAAFVATTSPYLAADPTQRERFRARYDDGRRLIGLSWQTKNRNTGEMRCNRSMDLSLFAPLFARPDIRWISLQYGDHNFLEAQAAAAGAPIFIDRSADQLSDIDMFAAQVAAMDMVLTIDNSTAHLAGALGVPVWTLLPLASDWRWLQTRGDSPWYPTMRLFRQSKPGDWQSVIQRVNDAL